MNKILLLKFKKLNKYIGSAFTVFVSLSIAFFNSATLFFLLSVGSSLVSPNEAFAAIPAEDINEDMWIVNKRVYSVLVDGGYTYVAGDFSYIGPQTGWGVVLDATTGDRITKFSRINGTVYSSISDGNGGFYVIGDFTKVGAYSREGLVHIEGDGSVDPNFDPQPDNTITSMVLNDGYLYVGGDFENINSESVAYIARLSTTDGSVDTGWTPDADSSVNALAVSGGYIYAGGYFTNIGSEELDYIARIDTYGVVDTGWNPDADSYVENIVVSGGNVYVGGNFTTIGSESRSYIARLDTTDGSADLWNPSADGDVNAMSLYGSDLYVAGGFYFIGGKDRFLVAKLSTSTGNADPDWDPAVDDFAVGVDTIMVKDGYAYVGGQFQGIGADERYNVAKVNLTDGSAVADWNPGAGDRVYTISVSGDGIFIGGKFATTGGETRDSLFRIVNSTGEVDESWNPDPNGNVGVVAADGNGIYVGGSFTSIGGGDRSGLAKLNKTDGSADPDWDPDVLGLGGVNTIAISGEDMYIGGTFSSVDGQGRNNIAKIGIPTGNVDMTWDPSANNEVIVVTIDGDDVYVGGRFTNIGGESRNYIAKLNNTDGDADLSWNPNASAGGSVRINAMVVDGSDVYVGGYFSGIGGKSRNGIAKLNNTDGSADLSWNPNTNGGTIDTIVIDGESMYVGGAFGSIGGQTRHYIARLAKSDGSVDLNWDPNASGQVYSIALDNGDAYVGGYFPGGLHGMGENDYAANFVKLDSLYQIYNLDPSLEAIDTASGKNVEGGGVNGVRSETAEIELMTDDLVIISGTTVDMTSDRNWSTVGGDSDISTKKSVVVNLASAPGASPSHALFIPTTLNDQGVRICPDATTLADISSACTNGVNFIENQTQDVNGANVTVTKVDVDGQLYWKAQGVTSTGGMSLADFSGEELAETGSDVWGVAALGIFLLSGITSMRKRSVLPS